MKDFMKYYNYLKTRTDIIRKLSPIKQTLLINGNKIQTKLEFTATYIFRDGRGYVRQKTVKTLDGNFLENLLTNE